MWWERQLVQQPKEHFMVASLSFIKFQMLAFENYFPSCLKAIFANALILVV
jgi:hypothetical protein